MSASRNVVALVDAVVSVSSDLDLSEVLSGIVRGGCDLVGARYAALGVLRPDGQALMEILAEGMTTMDRAELAHEPRGIGLLGVLIRDPRPIRIDDMAAHSESCGLPPGHPPMNTLLGVPIRVRGEVFGNLYLADKRDGTTFTDEDEALAVAYAAAAGVAIDNARLFETTRRQQLWADAISEMSQALLSGQRPRKALSLLVERAASASEASMAVVSVVNADGDLVVEAAFGPDRRGSDAVVGSTMNAPHWLEVIESGEVLLLSSKLGEGVANPPSAELRRTVGMPVHGQTAVIPMTVGGQPVGVLVVGWGTDDAYVAYDSARPLKQYADQAALTLTAATAQRDRSRMRLLEDRDRIARDMHDVVIQRLFATGLALQSATRLAMHPKVQSRIEHAVDELDVAIKDIRSAIFDLHHHAAATLGNQIQDVVTTFRRPLGFLPAVEIGAGLESLPSELCGDVLAVVREALSNVARHARATTARVTLHRHETSLQLCVEDDGIGLANVSRRSGLDNLAERASSHGGQLCLGPAEGAGTRLVWTVPLAG